MLEGQRGPVMALRRRLAAARLIERIVQLLGIVLLNVTQLETRRLIAHLLIGLQQRAIDELQALGAHDAVSDDLAAFLDILVVFDSALEANCGITGLFVRWRLERLPVLVGRFLGAESHLIFVGAANSCLLGLALHN